MTALREIPKRFFRSVRLDHDLNDPQSTQGYTITPQVRQILGRIIKGLSEDSTERAFTVTGPYGGGKSAFALFLSQLIQHEPKNNLAWTALLELDPALTQQLGENLEDGYLQPIALTLRRTSLSRNILEGLRQWLEQHAQTHPKASTLQEEIDNCLMLDRLDTRRVTNAVKTALEMSQRTKKCRGIIIILDELGKSLEYAARTPNEDIYLLQELAELASRSQKQRLMLIGILHQGFEQYAEALEVNARREWGKIQGRFADIPFLEPPAQQMWLATRALKSLNLPEQENYQNSLIKTAQKMAELGMTGGLDATAFSDLASQAYPLHPVVLMALPHVFRRFAQNERSLFAYLASAEPFAPLERLQTRGAGLVRLPELFDYLISAFGGNLVRHATAKYWLETTDIIEQQGNLTPLEAEAFKTIGLLKILSQASQLQPTEAMISLTLRDQTSDPEIRGILEQHLQRSTLSLRRSNDTYRIWEGSDVDIEGQLETGRHNTEQQNSLSATLEKYLVRRPMVARRHSFDTGTLRFFTIQYCDAPTTQINDGADGIILCCLPKNLAATQAFLEWAKQPEIANRNDVLIAIPQQLGAIREAAHELLALNWVQDNTPELRDDRVARRELSNRLALVERQLTESVEQLLNPAAAPYGANTTWHWQGQQQSVQRTRAVMQLLSTVMDNLYPQSPRLKNELINRRVISSAAAGARNTLMARMLGNAQEAQLGIEGYPPERSIYESLLFATGLHRQNENGWYFDTPDPESHLYPAWQELEARVFAALAEPEVLDGLYTHLGQPPFGVTQGIMPVLITALLQIYPNEISLYREGTFLPEPSVADLEVLVRRPELFSIAGGKVSGERIAVVSRLANSLGTEAATMPVVRALMKMVKSLPEYAWRSNKLSKNVLAIRAVFERARSPERLLYIEIPTALEQEPFADTGTAQESRVEEFFGLLNSSLKTWSDAYPQLLEKWRDYLLERCELPSGTEGWEALRAQARKLEGKIMHNNLAPIIKRLSATGDEQASLEGALALIASRPAKTWTDSEVAKFPAQADAIAKLLLEARHSNSILSKTENDQSKEVYKRLKTDFKSTPANVLRAALAKLLQEL